MDALSEHDVIRRHISHYFRFLDKRVFGKEWAREFFTEDVRTVAPVGTSEGIEETRRQVEVAIGRFARTQHVSSDVLVDVAKSGRDAEVGFNAVMTHVHGEETLRARGEGAPPVFTVGAHCTARLVRTDDGWRTAFSSIEVIWTTGQPPDLS